MRHFLFDRDGSIREFTHEDSVMVANGGKNLPEFADSRLRYLQVVVVQPEDEEQKYEVRMAAAYLTFDREGQLSTAEALDDDGAAISDFERQTCAELALRADIPGMVTVH